MTTICTYVYKNSIAKVISMIAKIATAFCGCSYITAGLTRYSIISTPTILAKIMQQYGVMFFWCWMCLCRGGQCEELSQWFGGLFCQQEWQGRLSLCLPGQLCHRTLVWSSCMMDLYYPTPTSLTLFFFVLFHHFPSPFLDPLSPLHTCTYTSCILPYPLLPSLSSPSSSSTFSFSSHPHLLPSSPPSLPLHVSHSFSFFLLPSHLILPQFVAQVLVGWEGGTMEVDPWLDILDAMLKHCGQLTVKTAKSF